MFVIFPHCVIYVLDVIFILNFIYLLCSLLTLFNLKSKIDWRQDRWSWRWMAAGSLLQPLTGRGIYESILNNVILFVIFISRKTTWLSSAHGSDSKARYLNIISHNEYSSINYNRHCKYKKKHTVGLISALVSSQEVSISQEVRVNTILSEGCIQDRYQKNRCCLDHN